MKKKLLSALLALAMVLTMLPLTAFAEDAAGTTLPAGTADETSSVTTIELTQDINLADVHTFSTGTIILDLKGFTITAPTNKNAIKVTSGTTVTIQDTSDGAAGKIVNNSTSSTQAYVIDNAGTLTIKSGNIVSTKAQVTAAAGRTAVRNNGAGAVLNISGGTISSDGYIAVKNDDGGNPTLNITGGTIKSAADPMNQAIQNWAICNISGGDIQGKVVTWEYTSAAGTTTISGGTITEDVMLASYQGQTPTDTSKAPTLAVSGENTVIKGAVGFLNVGDANGKAANATGTITVSDKATVEGGVFNGSKGSVSVDGANVSTVSNKVGGKDNGETGAAGAGTITVRNSTVTGTIDESVGVVSGCVDGSGNKINDVFNSNSDLKVEKDGTFANSFAGMWDVKVAGLQNDKYYLIRVAAKGVSATADGNSIIIALNNPSNNSYTVTCKPGQNVTVYELDEKPTDWTGTIKTLTEKEYVVPAEGTTG